MLADSIANTKEKLVTLKEAERQAQEQFKQGKINEEQYRALQREIVTAESKLKSLEEQYAKMGNTASRALDNLSQKTKNIGEKLTGAGTAMLPITAGIVAGGALAVKSMDAIDEGLDTITQKTGATGAAAKELEGVYQQVAQTVPAAFGDIGAAVGEINTRLDFTGEKLRVASEDFLKFAKVNGTDVNTSVQLVTRAMGDAGIQADDYKRILDMLTVAGQKSGISIDTLATNLAKYGAPMRALGIDTETAIAMFAGWEKAGVNTETAFSGMKKAISNWGEAGKDSAAEFQKTLDAIKAAPDIATATSMAIETFGAKAGPDLADAIQGGRFEVEEYITALKNAGGAVDSTYGKLVDEVDDTALAAQTLQVSLHDIGESVAKLTGPILKNMALHVKDIADRFNALNPAAQTGIIVFAGIAAALGPLLILLGQMANGISLITKGLSLLLANSIVLLIAAIVAAVAALALGIKYLWDTNEGFRAGLIAAWDAIVSVISTAVNAVIGFFTQTIPQAWGQVLNLFSAAGAWFAGIWQQILTGAAAAWMAIQTAVMAVVNAIVGQITTAWNLCKDGIFTALEGVKLIFTGAWEIIKNLVLGAVLIIIDLVTGNFTALGSDLAGIWENIKNGVATVWEGIKQYFSGLFEIIKSLFSAAWEKVKMTVVTVCNDIKTKITEIWNAVLTWLRELPGKLYTIGADLFKRMKDGVISTINTVVDAIKSGINTAIDWIKDLPRQAVAWGADMINGIAQGIRNAAKNVINSVKDLAESIRAYLHFSVPDVGPLTDYETWMPDFMSGLARGIEENRYKVEQAMRAVSYGIHTSFDLDADMPAYAAAGAPTAEIGIYLDGSQIAAVVTPLVSQNIDAQVTAAKRGRGLT